MTASLILTLWHKNQSYAAFYHASPVLLHGSETV